MFLQREILLSKMRICTNVSLEGNPSFYTVTIRKVKFRYIHRVTPDDNVPRPENVSTMKAWFLPALYQTTS